MPDQFTLEYAADRSDLAALFGEFAAALEDDQPAAIDVDGETATVAFPPRVSVSVAGTREEAPPTEAIELGLEWDATGERRLGLEPSADDEGAAATAPEGDAPSGAEDDRPAESASSVMPPDAFSSGEQAHPEPDPDHEEASGRRSRFEVYRDRAGEWRWRLVHWNGNIVADSGEGYASRYNATRAARGVMRATADARIEHLEP